MQSYISIDLATPRELPVPLDVAPVATAIPKARSDIRTFLGNCLLQLPPMVWMVLDIVLVSIGVSLGTHLFVWWTPPNAVLTNPNQWATFGVLASTIVLAGSVVGLYENRTLWSRGRIFTRCFLTVCLAMPAAWAILHLLMYSSMSRRSAATGVAFYLLTSWLIRELAHGAIRSIQRGLLVIGQGPCTGQIIRSVRRGSVPGYRLVGLVVLDDNEAVTQATRLRREGAEARGVKATEDFGDARDAIRAGRFSRRSASSLSAEARNFKGAFVGAESNSHAGDIPIAGRLADIEQICRDHDVVEVVVADRAADDPVYQRAALTCLRRGCRVTNETTFYEKTYGEVPAAHIRPSWFLAADLKGQREEHAVLKRLFDLAIASIGLIVSLPLWPIIALAIRLESRGPVFYTQTRVGQSGRTFTLMKFRTMRQDAETAGSMWAKPDDPRATRIGRFLRRSRLDELPQLINIIKGEMSLVGPRPERPEFVQPLATLIPFYDERHLIKPGLTGWAQINYRYGSNIADARRKLQLDLFYMKHMSIELDVVILLRTFGTFFRGGH